jgi:hypothetical protein
MNKERLLWAAVIISLLGSCALGVLHWQQSRDIATISGSLTAISDQLEKVASTKGQEAGSASVSADELRLRLAGKDWTELITATSPKGEFAVGLLKDIRFKNTHLTREDVRNLQLTSPPIQIFPGPFALTLPSCPEPLTAPAAGGAGSDENTPGISSVTIYSQFTTKPSEAKNLYFEYGSGRDPLGNQVLELYGPYYISPDAAVESFNNIRCLKPSEL